MRWAASLSCALLPSLASSSSSLNSQQKTWLRTSEEATADVTVHNNNSARGSNGQQTYFFKVVLQHSSSGQREANNGRPAADRDDHLNLHDQLASSSHQSPLHNTVLVLPELLSAAECELLKQEAQRVLNLTEKAGQCQGKETWALGSKFSPEGQIVLEKLLQRRAFSFLQGYLPGMLPPSDRSNGRKHSLTPSGENLKDIWDEAVVIKYLPGNRLAPHEDLRPLTLVVPLEHPTDGGGTTFCFKTACRDL
jgi:hypothetical protein